MSEREGSIIVVEGHGTVTMIGWYDSDAPVSSVSVPMDVAGAVGDAFTVGVAYEPDGGVDSVTDGAGNAYSLEILQESAAIWAVASVTFSWLRNVVTVHGRKLRRVHIGRIDA